MTGKLTRGAYERLVAEDLAWLDAQPRTLERDHVVAIVRASVDLFYPGPVPVVAEEDRLP